VSRLGQRECFGLSTVEQQLQLRKQGGILDGGDA
jgi:hypothetical protein